MSTRTRYSLSISSKIYSGRNARVAVASLYQSYKEKYLPPKPARTPVWQWLKEVLDTFQPKGVEYKVWSEPRRSRRKNQNTGEVEASTPRTGRVVHGIPRLTLRRDRPPTPEQVAPVYTDPPGIWQNPWEENIRTQPQAAITGGTLTNGQMLAGGLFGFGEAAQNVPAQEAWNAQVAEAPRVLRTRVHGDLTQTYNQYMDGFTR